MASKQESAPFLTPNVNGLEEGDKKLEDLNWGAFGLVFEVTVGNLPCKAKRVHNALLKDVSHRDKVSMQTRFRKECELLKELKHPNIVHFVGVCQGKSRDDLVMIMESLHTDVATFVEKHPNIPVSTKVSILLDVSYGLLYLHGQTSPIIHRDLTAPNVLLTADLRAKIADLGISKVLDDPSRIKLTLAPGNFNYMAPETKVRDPCYDTNVDIFSVGHLIIHLCIQDWPEVYEPCNRQAFRQALDDERMEIAKRETALREMGRGHCLYPLAIDCLQDRPERRPSTEKLNHFLRELSLTLEIQNPKDRVINLHYEVRELKQRLDSIKTERYNLSKQNLELLAVNNVYKEKLSEMDSLKSQIAVTRETVISLADKMTAKATEVSNLKKEKEALQKECYKLKEELEARILQAQNYEEDFKIERRERENMASKIEEEKLKLYRNLEKLRTTVVSLTAQLNDEKQKGALGKANLERELAEQEQRWMTEMEETIRGYIDQLNSQEQSCVEVKSELEEERRSKEQLESIHQQIQESLEKEIATLKEQNDIFCAEKLSLQEKVSIVETIYKQKEKYLEIMAAEKSNLEDQFRQMNAHYTASQHELTYCRKQLETTTAGHSDKERKLADQVELSTAHYTALQLELTDCRKQLETAIADTSRLSDDVLAKTQQVRHYKKQTDSYKATLNETADKLDETTSRLENTQMELQDRKDCIQRMEEDYQQHIEVVKAQLESDKLMAVGEMIDAQRAKSNLEKERQTQVMDGQMADMLKAETTIKEELEQKYSLLLDKSDSQFKAIQKLKQILAANGIPVPVIDIEMISSNIKSGKSSGSPVLHSSQQPRPAESRRRVSPTDQSFAQPRRVQNTPHPTRNPSQYNQPAPSDQYPPTGQKVEQTEQELSAMRHPPPHGVEPYSSGYNAASQYGHDNYRGHGAPQNIQDRGNRLEGGGAPGDRHVQVVQGQDLPLQQGHPPSQTPQRQDYYHSGIDIATPLAAGYNPQVHHPNVVETARRETGDRVAQYHSPAGQHHQTKPPGLGYPQTSQDSPAGQSCPQQGHPQTNQSYRQQGPPQASQIYPQQGTPQAIHPQQGHPQTSQSYSQQGPPQAIHPHQGQPQTSQGFPQQGHPQASQKYLQQRHLQANQGYPPQGPPQGYPANSGYPQTNQPFNYPTKSQPGDIHDQYNPGSTIGNSRDTQCDNSGYTPPSDETRGMDSLISDSVGTQAAGPPSPHPHKMAAQPRQEIPQTAPPPTQILLPVKPERPRAVVDDSIRENILLEGIDEDIENVAKEFEVTDEDQDQDTSLTGVPVDPNLVCPLCLRQFKLGEIQKYKRHVSKCDGKP